MPSGSPASARSGSRSSASVGRGALRHARATAKPASAALALWLASTSAGTSWPSTRCPGPNPGSSCVGDREERQRLARRRRRSRRIGAADDEHEAAALHADQHVGVEVAGGAAQLVDVEHARGGADEHADLAVPVPAERGDAARQLVVVLAGQDRVDDERFEPRIPEAARLGRARVDVGRGERDLARVQQDRLAQVDSPSSLTRSSTTSTVTRMSCSVCCRLTERSSSRGAAPKTSAAIHGVDLGSSYQLDERRDAGLGDEPDGASAGPAACRRTRAACPRGA